MDQDQRVVVHVDDAGLRGDLLGDLVDVGAGGDPGADVEELADPLLGEEADCPHQKRPVGAGGVAHLRGGCQHALGRRPVGGEVVLAAEQVVVGAGGMRDAGVDLRQRPARLRSGVVPCVARVNHGHNLLQHDARRRDDHPGPAPSSWVAARSAQTIANRATTLHRNAPMPQVNAASEDHLKII